MHEASPKTVKPFEIDRWLIQRAWLKVRENRGSAGIDKETIKQFDEHRADNLYKLWNRMSSGCYMPMAVRLVEIPKSNGGKPHGVSPSNGETASAKEFFEAQAFFELTLEKHHRLSNRNKFHCIRLRRSLTY